MFKVECSRLKVMSMEAAGHPEITEEMLAESAGRARWLIMGRLEQIWKTCQPHVDGSREEEQGSPPDPRWAEIGVRVLDRMVKLQRLDRSAAAADPEDEPFTSEETRRAILASLEDLEGRTAGQ